MKLVCPSTRESSAFIFGSTSAQISSHMIFTNSCLPSEDQLGTQRWLCEIKQVSLSIMPLVSTHTDEAARLWAAVEVHCIEECTSILHFKVILMLSSPIKWASTCLFLSLCVQYIVWCWLQQFCLPKQAVRAQCASQIAWLTSKSPARTLSLSLFLSLSLTISSFQSPECKTLTYPQWCCHWTYCWCKMPQSNKADVQKIVKGIPPLVCFCLLYIYLAYY